jgi:hypothetical protein
MHVLRSILLMTIFVSLAGVVCTATAALARGAK